MTMHMEIIDLIPNSMSFRVINTHDIHDHGTIPPHFTGRVRHWTAGTLVYVAWYQEGLLHNPGRSHPAYRRLRPTGELKYERWYHHGRLEDPAAGLPAVRGYYVDGSTHYEEHYLGGYRHDASDGTPAIVKWRQDGTVRHRLRYRHGIRSTDA